MSAYGPGELIEIDGRLTGPKYIRILEEVLIPTVRAMVFPPPDPIKLVQDLSPIHTSRIVNDWFSDHPEIELIDWPPKGCDMNPIKNLWSMMSRDWEVGEHRTIDGIRQKAFEVWESLRRRPDYCNTLVESMPKRLSEVIDARGGWSYY